jgi:hypothetical protein
MVNLITRNTLLGFIIPLANILFPCLFGFIKEMIIKSTIITVLRLLFSNNNEYPIYFSIVAL